MTRPVKFATEQESEDYLWSCVHVEPLCIQEEYVRLPSDMAYWNERYAAALGHWLELKAKRDRVYSRVYHDCLVTVEVNGKKSSVAAIDQDVQRSEAYQQVCTALVAAETEKVRLSGVLEALRTKRDMLVGLGAHLRAEMGMQGHGERD